MRITDADKKFLAAKVEVLKAPELDSPPAQRLPEVIETVSRMLQDIEKNGVDAKIVSFKKTNSREVKRENFSPP